MKIRCGDCGIYKSTEEFYLKRDRPGKIRYQHRCIPCVKIFDYNKQFKKYGILESDYIRMLTEQDYKCKICKSVNISKTRFHIDHCHKTGRVRGLLCPFCNKGLGIFRDSALLLEKAIKYLNRKDYRGTR